MCRELAKQQSFRAWSLGLPLFWYQLQVWGVPQISFRFDHLLERLTESYYTHGYCLLEGKDTDQNEPIEEMHRAKYGRIQNGKFPLSHRMRMCYSPILTCENTHIFPDKLTWASVSRVLLTDWITMWLNSDSRMTKSHGGLAGMSNFIVKMWDVASATPRLYGYGQPAPSVTLLLSG